MKKVIAVLAVSAVLFSCNKEQCEECHYDDAGQEVELGVKCDDELEDLEANGYTVNGESKEVHCGEGH